MSGVQNSIGGQISSLSGFLATATGFPLTGPWSTFNGSGATPFSNNGVIWEDSFLATTQTIALDSTRFIFIYGDPLSVAIGTYSSIGSAPTFGTAVPVDGSLAGTTLVGNMTLIAANKIYISYYDDNSPKRYGVVATVSGSTITIHTPTQIDAVNFSAYPSKTLSTIDSGRVIELISDGANNGYAQVMSIDGSNNVTFGTALRLTGLTIIEGASWGTIAALSTTLAFAMGQGQTGNQSATVAAISISGTTLALLNIQSLDNFKMNGQGATVVPLTSTSAICGWAAYNNTNVAISVNRLSLVGYTGSFSIGPILNARMINSSTGLDAALYLHELIYTGTTGQYLLLQQTISIDNPPVLNDFVQYVQLQGSILEAGNPVAINVNANAQAGAIPTYYGSMLDANTCVFPSMTYNGVDFGCVVFSNVNTLTDGDVIFFIEGDTNVTTTPTATLGTGSGILGSHLITVNGIDLSNMLIPLSTFKIATDPYVVDSILFTGGNTFITTTSHLTAPYLNDNVTADLITQIVDQSANAYVFSQSTDINQPITGFDIFGNQSILCYGNNGNPTYLECDNINFPPCFKSYISVVAQATDTSVYLVTGILNDALSFMFDINSQSIQINNGNLLIGNYDLSIQTNLVECLRVPYGSKVTFNGSPNDSNSDDMFALGRPLNYLIGTRPDLAVPFAGPIYAVKLRWGQPTAAQIASDRAYFISKYGIT